MKDHMRRAGDVLRADVFEDDRGRSRGYGVVEYSSGRDAAKAIKELNNTILDGRSIFVREVNHYISCKFDRMKNVDKARVKVPLSESVAPGLGLYLSRSVGMRNLKRREGTKCTSGTCPIRYLSTKCGKLSKISESSSTPKWLWMRGASPEGTASCASRIIGTRKKPSGSWTRPGSMTGWSQSDWTGTGEDGVHCGALKIKNISMES